MHIQRQIGDPPNGLNDRNPDADVRHEVAIHHVQVQAEAPAASTALTSCSKWAKSHANSDGSMAGLAARSRAFNSSRPSRNAIQVPGGR